MKLNYTINIVGRCGKDLVSQSKSWLLFLIPNYDAEEFDKSIVEKGGEPLPVFEMDNTGQLYLKGDSHDQN